MYRTSAISIVLLLTTTYVYGADVSSGGLSTTQPDPQPVVQPSIDPIVIYSGTTQKTDEHSPGTDTQASPSDSPTANPEASTKPANSGQPSKASTIQTVTMPDGSSTTIQVPSGSPITSRATVVTQGSTLTVGPVQPADSPSTVQTLTQSDGSTITLTLPSDSKITGQTTLVTDGSTLQVAPASTPTASLSASGLSIVVDDSTIKLPSSTSTITAEDGSTLIVGPTNIVQDGVTIPISTEPTTLTTEGVKVTFGAPPTATEASPTPTPPDSSDEPATTITGTPAITPPPSGSPGFIPTTFPPRGSSESQVAVTLRGETYVLPHTVSVELLQSDGSFITLFSNSIASGSATLSVPPSSSQTSLALDDLSLDIGPLRDSATDGDGGGGSGGGGGGGGGLSSLVDDLIGLAGNANSIVNTLDGIGELGVSWADGTLSDSQFSSDVQSLLNSATSELTDFVSDLSSTIESYGSEVYEMTDDGLRRIFPARTGAVQELDLLKSLKKLTPDITTLRDEVLAKARNYWIQGTASAGALAAAEEGLRKFGGYNWGKEDKRKPSTTSSNSTTAMSSTQSSSTDPPAAKKTGTPDRYVITTKPDTELSLFQEFIKTLPDGGEGDQVSSGRVPWQLYITNLTSAQAKDAASKPFVLAVVRDIEMDTGTYGAIPSMEHIKKRAPSADNLQQRLNSEDHLKVVSVANQRSLQGDLPDYLFDPALGQGQTIYVLDGGFNLDHNDFSDQSGRSVRSKVIENRYTLAREPNRETWAPEDITDYDGHGTMVASVAGGHTYGVASKADLVLVKFRQAARNPSPFSSGRYIYRGVTPSALQVAWRWLIDDVLEQRANGKAGRFIVNMSYGFDFGPTSVEPIGSGIEVIMQSLLESSWRFDIITVVAAGNDGIIGLSLEHKTPQLLGTTDNALITVGGVDHNGLLAPRTTFDAGRGGSLTVYAVSENVNAADWRDSAGSRIDSGTSFAAPAVAGLAAYLASLPSLDGQWTEGDVALTMKNYLVRHSYPRLANPIPADLPLWYRPVPARVSIKVAYNRAPDGLCASSAPAKRGIESGNLYPRVKRQKTSGDVDVVVSGELVDASFGQSYCDAGTKPALTSKASPSAAPTAPTRDIEQGILTCGTRPKDSDTRFWFQWGSALSASYELCNNLTSSDTPVVFEPGSSTSVHIIKRLPEDDTNVRASARWNNNDPDCPTTRFSSSEGNRLCLERIQVPMTNCDGGGDAPDPPGHQGGKFFRDCITWTMESQASYDAGE